MKSLYHAQFLISPIYIKIFKQILELDNDLDNDSDSDKELEADPEDVDLN